VSVCIATVFIVKLNLLHFNIVNSGCVWYYSIQYIFYNCYCPSRI